MINSKDYARVVDILTSDLSDNSALIWSFLISIAKSHPALFLDHYDIAMYPFKWPSWRMEALKLMGDGKKVAAIKKARESAGLGLEEAKEYVEKLWEDHGDHPYKVSYE